MKDLSGLRFQKCAPKNESKTNQTKGKSIMFDLEVFKRRRERLPKKKIENLLDNLNFPIVIFLFRTF